MTKLKQWTKICFVILLFFVIFDIALRFRYPTSEFPLKGLVVQYDGYYKFTPGKIFLPKSDVPNSINSLGFRGQEFSDPKIFVFGGSCVYGAYLQDNETFPYQLQKMLGIETANCGLPAFKIKDIYNLFSKEIIRYNPEVIIIYSAWNDAFQPELKRTWLDKWMLYRVLKEKIAVIKYNHYAPYYSLKDRIPLDFRDYLEKIVKLAQASNIRAILVKQPMPEKIEGSPKQLFMETKNERKRRTIIQHYFCDQLDEAGVQVIDPRKDFKSEYFLDAIHLSAKGCNFLAKKVYEQF